jgi:hypothetical protein
LFGNRQNRGLNGQGMGEDGRCREAARPSTLAGFCGVTSVASPALQRSDHFGDSNAGTALSLRRQGASVFVVRFAGRARSVGGWRGRREGVQPVVDAAGFAVTRVFARRARETGLRSRSRVATRDRLSDRRGGLGLRLGEDEAVTERSGFGSGFRPSGGGGSVVRGRITASESDRGTLQRG